MAEGAVELGLGDVEIKIGKRLWGWCFPFYVVRFGWDVSEPVASRTSRHDLPTVLAALPFRIHSYVPKKKTITKATAAKGTISCRRPTDSSSEDMVDADCRFSVIVMGISVFKNFCGDDIRGLETCRFRTFA